MGHLARNWVPRSAQCSLPEPQAYNMSSVYVNEPPTDGKVILHTTVGEIEVELWSKEIPKGCRNFVQLCLEGYYDNTIFHRVIKDFIVQGGDPTGTGQGKLQHHESEDFLI